MSAQVNELQVILKDSVAQGSFVKLHFAKPTQDASDLKSIDVRPIIVKRELKLSFTYHHKTRDIVKNYNVDETAKILAELLKSQFMQIKFYSIQEDIIINKKGGSFELLRQAPSQATAPELSHDIAKKRLIENTHKHYLTALKIADDKGNIYKTTQDKFRQINKYIEILDGLIKKLPTVEILNIVDMGAGKGYLTFALYDHLVNNLKINAKVTGVEYRADLVKLCNEIAVNSGFDGLNFVEGTIENYDCAGANIVIALHACDTATDDAIAKAIFANTDLIVMAPCCHKQIRRQISDGGKNPIELLMKYGTYVERISEMVTDAMRAQILEIQGYQTNLFEFISDNHTPKNVMIVANKISTGRTSKEVDKLQEALNETKAQFGIKWHQLEHLLSSRHPADL